MSILPFNIYKLYQFKYEHMKFPKIQTKLRQRNMGTDLVLFWNFIQLKCVLYYEQKWFYNFIYTMI